MTDAQAIDLITAELARARGLHPTWPEDMIHGAGVVCEEAGELMTAALDARYFNADPAAIDREAVHTAATCVRVLVGR